jgi:DNA-directed RNA polymerase specialized sigma24 family protein
MFQAAIEADLYRSDDDELLRYIAEAKRAGELEHARTAMHLLLYKHERRIRRRVGLRLPEHLSHHEDTVAEWVLERVMQSALRLTLEGESVGEWVRWYSTIVERQVISFFRSTQGKALERELDDAPPELSDAFDSEQLISRIHAAGIVQNVLDRMENPMHVAVVRAAIFDDLPSAEVAAAHGTSVANVDQIKSRFKAEVRAECERMGAGG